MKLYYVNLVGLGRANIHKSPVKAVSMQWMELLGEAEAVAFTQQAS